MSRTLLLLLSLLSTCCATQCYTCHQISQHGYASKHLLALNHLIVRTVKESGFPACKERAALRTCGGTCRIMEWKRTTGERDLAVRLFMCAGDEARKDFERISPYRQVMECENDGCNAPKSFALKN